MADEFSREVTRQAVARAALALDFKEADEAVLDTLAEVVQSYIETLGEVTHENAETAGRAYPGIQDAIASLENMKSTTKTNWRELNLFAFGKSSGTSSSSGPVWSQPFPFPVSTFPSTSESSSSNYQHGGGGSHFSQSITSGDQSLPPHLPSHFPPFPPSHTYKKTHPPSSISGNKRSAEELSSAQQRAKKLQVAKNIQQSITALEEIVEKDVSSSASVSTQPDLP